MDNINWTKEVNDIAETTSELVEKEWQEYLETIDFDSLRIQIIKTLQKLRKNVQIIEHEYLISGKYGSEEYWVTRKAKLDAIIDLIYQDFFILQNLINAYEGQQVKITYVQKDSSGNRQIVLFDNTAAALSTQKGNYGPYTFMKIGYKLPSHYQILKNTLPDTTNNSLQETTKIAEQRYLEQKRIIYWRTKGDKFQGYQLTNRGPINEAFVNFYLHTQPGKNPFKYDIERNIQTFVMHDRLGVRQADSLNGFLVGDVSKNTIQYAVKGEYASPQGYKQVLKLLADIQDNTTHQDLKKILKNFRAITKDRAHSLVREAGEKELKEIEKTLQKNKK